VDECKPLLRGLFAAPDLEVGCFCAVLEGERGAEGEEGGGGERGGEGEGRGGSAGGGGEALLRVTIGPDRLKLPLFAGLTRQGGS